MTYQTDFRRDDGMWTRIKMDAPDTISEGFFPSVMDCVVDADGKVWRVSNRIFEYGKNHTTVVFYCKAV